MEIQNFQKIKSRIEKTDGISATASPPSSSSSPAHEFSFTISVHQHSPSSPKLLNQSSPPFTTTAIDLSPADNIFFHGHLLPLHLLSQFPVISPRTSTNFPDDSSLPINDLLVKEDQTNLDEYISFNNTEISKLHDNFEDISSTAGQGRTKSKSFSLFSLSKWRKGHQVEREKDDQETRHNKKKLKFDVVNQVLKRYIKMVRPLLSFKSAESRRSSSSSLIVNKRFHNQPHSFSGSTSSRCKENEFRQRRRREFSAPASMRTSPANSGQLTPNRTTRTSTSDSTMEELQAAIQAAIIHCKNSITMEEKVKC